jgi:mono/diheme cytochrome c family protein
MTGVAGGGAIAIGGGSAYGGGGSCQGVVQAEITQIDSAGVPGATMRFDAVLAVDVAVAPTSGLIAVAQAGERDPEQPLPSFVDDSGNNNGGSAVVAPSGPGGPGFGSVMMFLPQSMIVGAEQSCTFPNNGVPVQGQPTAVAFAPDDTVVVQSREPAQISIMRNAANFPADPGPLVVDLGGASVFDTGHALFHRDAGAGIACASCHAEGGDDGHVWHFAGIGPRRTQSVNVGLDGTQPFHWSGDQADVPALMEDVFVQRMGGVHESPARTQALQGWLFALTPLPAQRLATDKAALRGQKLFEGDAQCGTCHNGAKLTDNKTVDVGTGEPLQVPSLRGVGYRAPLIHNGCATTLKDRFDPACGGDKHGNTAKLSDGQISDLIAYLQTL